MRRPVLIPVTSYFPNSHLRNSRFGRCPSTLVSSVEVVKMASIINFLSMHGLQISFHAPQISFPPSHDMKAPEDARVGE